MNDEAIADLKQFIATTVRQEVTTVVRQEVAGLATKEDLAALDAKLDNVQASIAQATDASNDDVDEQLKSLRRRVGRLEHRGA